MPVKLAGDSLAPASRAHRPAAPAAPAAKRRLFTAVSVFSLVVIALLVFGWEAPTERYISPRHGLGYALGITGGSLMLALFLYSARKRIPFLQFLGPATEWFRIHMVLGILGPLCILYHCNFSLGATNSNVALISMLTVAGSGLIGRYIYAHIHAGLYGRKLNLEELHAGAAGLRSLSGTIDFLPDLLDRLEAVEQRLLNAGPSLPLLGVLRPVVIASHALFGRWRLHGYIRKALREAARTSRPIKWELKRLKRTACAYVDRRLASTRRVAEFQGFERLFSLWHALHLPLIAILIAAVVVHIIAVNVY
ncbi:MAG TPA: hypothetical protein VLW26_03235 [Steroidobacteraceae bacterium]|nr:hypothetical protein [Steroidobacteraceae bacterium]